MDPNNLTDRQLKIMDTFNKTRKQMEIELFEQAYKDGHKAGYRKKVVESKVFAWGFWIGAGITIIATLIGHIIKMFLKQ